MKAEIGGQNETVSDKFYIVDDVTGGKIEDEKDIENIKKCIFTLLNSRTKGSGGGIRPSFGQPTEPQNDTLYTLMGQIKDYLITYLYK